MEILGYFASFLMGMTLGLMGGGGSILTVPILVYLFGIPPLSATGLSLFVVGSTALVGGLMYVRRGEFDLVTGLSFAIPSALGVGVARTVVLPSLPTTIVNVGDFIVTKDILIMVTFAILMVLASYSMIRRKTDRKPRKLTTCSRIALLAVEGLIVGLIVGFVGAGGGFLIIPALVIFAGMQMRKAVGTSLLIISFQSLLGFTADISQAGPVDWPFLGLMTAIAVLGILLGSTLAQKVNEQKLKFLFGWFVLVMGAAILFQQMLIL